MNNSDRLAMKKEKFPPLKIINTFLLTFDNDHIAIVTPRKIQRQLVHVLDECRAGREQILAMCTDRNDVD